MMRLERLCGGSTRYSLHHRGLYFQITPVGEKLPQQADNFNSFAKGFPDLRVDDEINITLPVAHLDIG